MMGMKVRSIPALRIALFCAALCLCLVSCRGEAQDSGNGAAPAAPAPAAEPENAGDPDLPLDAIAAHKGLGWPLQNISLVVDKKERTISLYSRDTFVKSWPVAFGSSPRGHKTREGDSRTPEGVYYIFKYTSPSFGRCFYIAYPNLRDAQLALDSGRITKNQFNRIKSAVSKKQKPPHDTPLGGLILLHGTKDRSQTGLTDTDWTLGCIAMENRHLLELLDAVPDGAKPRLTIRPWPEE